MKRIKQVCAIAGSVLVFAACQNPDQGQEPIAKENNTTNSQRYIDPNTGAPYPAGYSQLGYLLAVERALKLVQIYFNHDYFSIAVYILKLRVSQREVAFWDSGPRYAL